MPSIATIPVAISVDRRRLPEGMTVGRWTAPDGWSIRRFDWPAERARGSLLFQAGRGDIFEKYLESFAHWHASGWTIAGFDWRGHGGSGRMAHDAGHASEFAPSVADLAAQWRAWRAATPEPHVLLGHSMGGFLGLRALAERAVDPAGFVAIAPMWGLRSPLGARAGERVAGWMAARRDPAQPAFMSGGIKRRALLTGDADRYADEQWWHDALPDHRLGTPSWAWLHDAFAATRQLRDDPRLARVTTPTLVLVADRDRLVDPGHARRTAARLPNAELVRFPDAAHEILREREAVRTRAVAAIDAFLARFAP